MSAGDHAVSHRVMTTQYDDEREPCGEHKAGTLGRQTVRLRQGQQGNGQGQQGKRWGRQGKGWGQLGKGRGQQGQGVAQTADAYPFYPLHAHAVQHELPCLLGRAFGIQQLGCARARAGTPTVRAQRQLRRRAHGPARRLGTRARPPRPQLDVDRREYLDHELFTVWVDQRPKVVGRNQLGVVPRQTV